MDQRGVSPADAMRPNEAAPRPVALVTGEAVIGLARVLALALAKAGYDVAFSYRFSDAAALLLRVHIESLGVQGLAVRVDDLSEPEAPARLVDTVAAKFGRLDLLLNSATSSCRVNSAYCDAPSLLDVTWEEWDTVMALNLRAPFLLIRHAAPLLRASRGNVVNVADLSTVHAWTGYPHHSVSEAGLLHLTKVTARALAPEVRVNAVVPAQMPVPSVGCIAETSANDFFAPAAEVATEAAAEAAASAAASSDVWEASVEYAPQVALEICLELAGRFLNGRKNPDATEVAAETDAKRVAKESAKKEAKERPRDRTYYADVDWAVSAASDVATPPFVEFAAWAAAEVAARAATEVAAGDKAEASAKAAAAIAAHFFIEFSARVDIAEDAAKAADARSTDEGFADVFAVFSEAALDVDNAIAHRVEAVLEEAVAERLTDDVLNIVRRVADAATEAAELDEGGGRLAAVGAAVWAAVYAAAGVAEAALDAANWRVAAAATDAAFDAAAEVVAEGVASEATKLAAQVAFSGEWYWGNDDEARLGPGNISLDKFVWEEASKAASKAATEVVPEAAAAAAEAAVETAGKIVAEFGADAAARVAHGTSAESTGAMPRYPGQREDFVQAVLYLASARFVTGEVMVCDGGQPLQT